MMTYYNVSTTVNYTCNSGFTLIGSNNVTCLPTLSWSTQPVCAINCPSPPTIVNGGIQNQVSGYKNGDNIQYVCNANYVMVRPRSGTNYGGNNTCLPTGIWMYRSRDYLPTCLPGCFNPPMFGAGNGTITPVKASYMVGDTVQYLCMLPYRIIGSTSNECVQAGNWLHNAGPECYDGCTDLPIIASNGDHMPIGRIHPTQTNVTYNCSENYSLKGDVNNRCLPPVHTWSQTTAPMCLRNCPTPPQVTGGTTTVVIDPIPGKSVAGMKVNYSCPADYAMQVTIMDNTCNSSGAWGSAAPVCVRSCGPPPTVTVGTNTFSPNKAVYFLNETVTYVCSNGLTLVGESTTQCKNDTKWTSTPPQCFASCQRPTTANGSLVLIQPDRASYREGTTITFTCRYNAKLTGKTNATCQRNTTWDAPLPQCGCGPPPHITVGTGTFTPSKPDFIPGEVVTYTCGNGFTLVGNSTTICQNDNSWSNQSPQCLTKCTRPTIATGSNVKIQPDQLEYLEGTNITFTCENNVTLSGVVSSTCLRNTTWDATLPTCGVVIPKMSLVLTLLCAVLVALISH
ncbi:complement receptor type 2-like [Ciona intestinalis]